VREWAAALEAEYPAIGGVLARLSSDSTLTTWPPLDSSTGTKAHDRERALVVDGHLAMHGVGVGVEGRRERGGSRRC
jgi:hypothetical protein